MKRHLFFGILTAFALLSCKTEEPPEPTLDDLLTQSFRIAREIEQFDGTILSDTVIVSFERDFLDAGDEPVEYYKSSSLPGSAFVFRNNINGHFTFFYVGNDGNMEWDSVDNTINGEYASYSFTRNWWGCLSVRGNFKSVAE